MDHQFFEKNAAGYKITEFLTQLQKKMVRKRGSDSKYSVRATIILSKVTLR